MPHSASSCSASPPGFLVVLTRFSGWGLPGIHEAHSVLVFISTQFNTCLLCSCGCQALRDAEDEFVNKTVQSRNSQLRGTDMKTTHRVIENIPSLEHRRRLGRQRGRGRHSGGTSKMSRIDMTEKGWG